MMGKYLSSVAVAGVLLVAMLDNGAQAQKPGGVLRVYHRDSPASMSIHEEGTNSTEIPMMGVFNNLVVYDQHIAQNSLDTIRPDLADTWSWSEDGKQLMFKLHQGVKWHDGKPFTSADVKCTFDLLTGRAKERFRANPRKSWWNNVEDIATNGDLEATFVLKRPQPALLTLLASGYTPIYPCHVSPQQMRLNPIGTGPFKFVEFKPNEHIKVTRNPDYWKPGRPYLDGLEYTIIRNVSTAMLTFVSGKLDITFGGLSVPLTRQVQEQAPQAYCELNPTNVSRNLVINRDIAPFDNAELRRAMTLSLDRQAFLTILTEGKGSIGGVMQPPPEGVWGMPPETLHTLPGYEPNVAENRKEAREIMKKLGYGPGKRLAIKVTTRDLPFFRDTAVILIDQLKEIYVDGVLEPVDTTQWFPRLYRKDFTVALNFTGNGVDDRDQNFYENYACGAEGNYIKYCNSELDRLIDQQSMEPNQEKRKALVWAIERKLAEDGVRPVIMYFTAGNCRQPYVKGLTLMNNSIYNGWRMEDVWLDK
jgi:peptide/nickel transport system substrate-binding protein